MKTFSNIRFKKKTAQRFQEFSRRLFKTHTEALETMLDFFLYNEISPKETLGPNSRTLEAAIKKRINSLIAIIKDIEKHQTKPTTAMLLSLFEEKAKQKKPKLVEVKFAKVPTNKETIEVTVPKIRHDRLEAKMKLVKKDFIYVLDNAKVVKSSFGKGYLKLELTEDELVKFRRSLNNY